jgi:pyridoxine 4-dehydrogenase
MTASTIQPAHLSGTFKIGGEIPIHRLGFGTMRITGPKFWGPPQDTQEALRTLRALPDLGVDFVDTADSYGPNVSEELIREALHPYTGMFIATKAGQTRPSADEWVPNGRPEYLKKALLGSLSRLGLDQIPLWQLHRVDPKVPRDEQFDAVAAFQAEGLIRYAGLSEVSVDDIEAASKFFPVATVQNRYNLADREHESVLQYCEANGIGFIPWFPLASGDLMKEGSPLQEIASKRNATASQIALAWLLKKSPVMLPIPGTSKRDHLVENIKAAEVELTDGEFEALSRLA